MKQEKDYLAETNDLISQAKIIGFDILKEFHNRIANMDIADSLKRNLEPMAMGHAYAFMIICQFEELLKSKNLDFREFCDVMKNPIDIVLESYLFKKQLNAIKTI